MPVDVGRIALRRRAAALDFDEGRLPDAEAELTRLIGSIPRDAAGQERRELCECLTSRALVLRVSNRWEDALRDLDAAETLSAALMPLSRRLILSSVYAIRAKLLVREDTPVRNLKRARDDLARWRALGGDGWMFDDLEAELARHDRDWERVAALSARVAGALGGNGWPVGESFACLRTAEALLELGRLADAETEARRAHEFFMRLGPPDRLAAAELLLARILAARGQAGQAWPHAEKALELGEHLIRHFRSLADQHRFATDKLAAYGHAFDIALAAGGEAGLWRAWGVAERAKSFYLCQLVANGDVDLFEGLAEGAGEQLRELDRAIDELETRMSEAGRDRENLARERAALAEKYDRALTEAMRTNPRWAALRVPPPLDLQASLAALGPEWSVLSHYWRGPALHLFFAGRDRRPVHRTVTWTADELQALEAHRAKLERDGGSDPLLSAFPAALAPKVFPADLAEALPRDTPLLISSHGVLANAALHAIPLAAHQHLIERCPVLMIPTLALLALSRPRKADRAVLLLGCEQDAFRNPPLSAVPGELETLARTWSRHAEVAAAVVPPLGTPADAGHPPESWSRFEVLHLACHGTFEAANPLDAALLLGRDRVPASTFFRVRLNASLVVLSACDVGRRTNRLEQVAGGFDEWLGIYVPLFYAGARMLLASRWPANSERGAMFMSVFHEALAAGESPMQAMRKASLHRRRGPEPFWSNWTLVGIPGQG